MTGIDHYNYFHKTHSHINNALGDVQRLIEDKIFNKEQLLAEVIDKELTPVFLILSEFEHMPEGEVYEWYKDRENWKRLD